MDLAILAFKKGLTAAINVHPGHFLNDIREKLEALEKKEDYSSVFKLKLPYHTWDVQDKKCNRLRWTKKRPTHTASLNFDVARQAESKDGKRKVKIWRKIRKGRKNEIVEVEEEIDVNTPIIEVGVRFEREPPVEGFSPIDKTVAGHSGTINKGARNSCIICVKYMDEKTNHVKPITGIQISEETTVVNNPVLFKGIPHSLSGRYPANVNRGTQGPPVFLSVSRGTGAPLTRLGVVVVQQELIPSSSMQVAYASSTAPATLNPGHKHESVYICHQSDISGVMARANLLCEAHKSELRLTPKTIGLFGLIVAAVHCNFSQMVVTALQACDLAYFPYVMRHFVYEMIADRTPCFVGQFSVVERSEVAFFLCNNVMRHTNRLVEAKYGNITPGSARRNGGLQSSMSSTSSGKSLDSLKFKRRGPGGMFKRMPSLLAAKVLAAALALDDSLSVNVNSASSSNTKSETESKTSRGAPQQLTKGDRRASTIPTMSSTTGIASNSSLTGTELDESLRALIKEDRSAFTALVKYFVKQLDAIAAATQNAGQLEGMTGSGGKSNKSLVGSTASLRGGNIKLRTAFTADGLGREENAGGSLGGNSMATEVIMEEGEVEVTESRGRSDALEAQSACRPTTEKKMSLDAQKEAPRSGKETPMIVKDIVQNLAENVGMSKSLSSLESSFLSHDRVSTGLCNHISSAVDIALADDFSKLLFMAMMLLAKRIQVGSSYHTPSTSEHSHPPPGKDGSGPSESGEEREDIGLHVSSDFIAKDVLACVVNLRRLLEAGDHLTREAAGKYLMRRFVFVGIVELCASPWHRRFKPGLGLFLIFHRKYRDFMPTEIGVMLDCVFLPMLVHPLSEQLDRRIVLNVVKGITVSALKDGKGASSLGKGNKDKMKSRFIDLYYNYDNHLSWPNSTVVSIFKALRAVVLKEVDENQAAITSLRGFREQLEVKWLQEKAITVLGDMIDQLVEYAGMKIVVKTDTKQRHWKSLKSIKYRASGAKKKGGRNEKTDAKDGKGVLEINDVRSDFRKDSCSERREMKAKRKGEFAKAHDKFRDLFQSEDDNLKGKAVRYACKYLIRVGMGEPYQIADFLYEYSSKMNKVQIADYLAMGEKEDDFHSEVRRYYMTKIDLTQVDFAKAFRIFVCDSGFHVGGLEAQRLNRMSECFAEVYLRDNPDCGIHEVYGADALAQSLLFIHTVKFNKANDPKQGGPQLPTSAEFVSMMRGQNKRHDEEKEGLVDDNFEARFLERQYNDILSKEIGINKDSDADRAKSKRKRWKRSRRVELHDSFSKNLRRAYAMLSSNAPNNRTFLPSKNPNLAGILLDEVGFEIYTTCNDITERVALNPDTVGMVQLCLEVCMKVIAVCIELKQKELLKWMLDVVGKRAWALKVLEETAPTLLDRDPVINDSEAKNQSKFKTLFWYKNIRLNLSKGRNEEAKQIVLDEVSRMHVKLKHLSHQTALGKLQKSFGDTHVMLAPQRIFIMKEQMQKVSESRNKTQDYTFFLFNDILIYAERRSNGTFSIHRVLHLALCRLKPIDALHFRICSSQKSFTIRAPSEKVCKKWVATLEKCIEERIKATGQNQFEVSESHRSPPPGLTDGTPGPKDSDGEQAQVQMNQGRASPKQSRMSFPSFTSSSLKLSSRNTDERKRSTLLKHGEWVCTLCLRKHGRRTRKVKCAKCEIITCKSCAQHKLKKKPVCDSCYGQFEMKFPGSASINGSTTTNFTAASQFVNSTFSQHPGGAPPLGLPPPASLLSLRARSAQRKNPIAVVTESTSAKKPTGDQAPTNV